MTTARHPFDSQWEYKIVRARQGEFGQRAHLDALLEQEARAGWVIVEKYNNATIRLRRPRAARAWDASLPPDVDSYRTVYVPSQDDEWIHIAFWGAWVIFTLFIMVLVGVLATLPG